MKRTSNGDTHMGLQADWDAAAKTPSDRSTRATSQQEKRSTLSGNPNKKNPKASGSFIWKLKTMIENIFSHRGMFFLGVVVAVITFGINIHFYFALLLFKAGLAPLWAGFGATIIAGTTTMFETVPLSYKLSSALALDRIFAAASKPQHLPELNPNTVGDAEEMLIDYRDNSKVTHEGWQKLRYGAIAVEVFLGVLYGSALGSGIRAVFGLLIFIGSVVGCPWGISLAIRSAELEPSPERAKQKAELIAGAESNIKLRKI
jgi:hypothetical protein